MLPKSNHDWCKPGGTKYRWSIFWLYWLLFSAMDTISTTTETRTVLPKDKFGENTKHTDLFCSHSFLYNIIDTVYQRPVNTDRTQETETTFVTLLCPCLSSFTLLCPSLSSFTLLCSSLSSFTLLCLSLSSFTLLFPSLSSFTLLCSSLSSFTLLWSPVSSFTLLCSLLPSSTLLYFPPRTFTLVSSSFALLYPPLSSLILL